MKMSWRISAASATVEEIRQCNAGTSPDCRPHISAFSLKLKSVLTLRKFLGHYLRTDAPRIAGRCALGNARQFRAIYHIGYLMSSQKLACHMPYFLILGSCN